jgi:hypothetical protein
MPGIVRLKRSFVVGRALQAIYVDSPADVVT